MRGRDLVERGDGKAGLAVLERVAQQLLILGDEAADARAAGRKALGNGVDDDDVLRRFLGKGAEGLQRLAAVDELAVGFVADEEQIMLLGEVNEHLHLVVRQHHAGGVAGVRDHDGAGVGIDERLDLLALGVVIALLGAGRDGSDGRAAGAHHGVVVGVERLGDEDLVAVVEDALERDGKRLAAAGGDVDLALIEVHIELIVVALDGVDQLRDTGGGSVFEHGLLELADGFKKGGRCLHVGLADVQVIDLDAARLGRHRIGVELTHRGLAAFFDLAGKLHEKFLLIF